MTAAEETAYLHRETIHLDAGAGYPAADLCPVWIRRIREAPPPGFVDVPPAHYLRIISGYFARRFRTNRGRILLTRACTDAFAYAAQAVIRQPGDEVIVIDTSFEPYPLLLRQMGARVVYARRTGSGIPDPGSVAAACTERTRAVVLIVPDNPLGVITPRAVMNQIADLCKQRRITLIVDYALAEANPFGRDIPLVHELASSDGLSWIMLGDTSKVLGLAGAKLGAVMHPGGELGERLQAARSAWFFEFDQLTLATVATIISDSEHRWPVYLDQLRGRIAANYSCLSSRVRPPLRVEPLMAGCFALIDVAGTGLTSEAFAGLLRSNHATLVIPASVFPTGQSPGPPDSRIRVALSRTGAFTARLAATLNGAAR